MGELLSHNEVFKKTDFELFAQNANFVSNGNIFCLKKNLKNIFAGHRCVFNTTMISLQNNKNIFMWFLDNLIEQ